MAIASVPRVSIESSAVVPNGEARCWKDPATGYTILELPVGNGTLRARYVPEKYIPGTAAVHALEITDSSIRSVLEYGLNLPQLAAELGLSVRVVPMSEFGIKCSHPTLRVWSYTDFVLVLMEKVQRGIATYARKRDSSQVMQARTQALLDLLTGPLLAVADAVALGKLDVPWYDPPGLLKLHDAEDESEPVVEAVEEDTQSDEDTGIVVGKTRTKAVAVSQAVAIPTPEGEELRTTLLTLIFHEAEVWIRPNKPLATLCGYADGVRRPSLELSKKYDARQFEVVFRPTHEETMPGIRLERLLEDKLPVAARTVLTRLLEEGKGYLATVCGRGGEQAPPDDSLRFELEAAKAANSELYQQVLDANTRNSELHQQVQEAHACALRLQAENILLLEDLTRARKILDYLFAENESFDLVHDQIKTLLSPHGVLGDLPVAEAHHDWLQVREHAGLTYDEVLVFIADDEKAAARLQEPTT